jgi:cytochrome c6
MGTQICNRQITIVLEGTVTKWNLKNNVALSAGTFALLLFLGSSASAQDTGEALFKGKCAMCHGPDGAGKTKMGETLKIPDLQSADVQKKSDADLSAIIAKGKNKMPAYEAKLSKEDIAKLVVYIRELAKKST